MSQKYQILIFLNSPEKIEVNRYPNRRKSPRITGCGWPLSWDKISVFLPIWGISKEILLNSAEDRTSAKNITRSQNTKNIGIYGQSGLFTNPWSDKLSDQNNILPYLLRQKQVQNPDDGIHCISQNTAKIITY